MAYGDFKTLNQTLKAFNLQLQNKSGLFANTSQLEPSAFLLQLLDRQLDLALAIETEKAKSELIVTPILLEIRDRAPKPISYFSGVNLNIDSEKGLNGECDFVLSAADNQFEITAPVLVLVEAKNGEIRSGLGQCAAQMVGSALLNQSQNLKIPVYGAVTNGVSWRFLRLSDQVLEIDLTEYVIPPQLSLVLGILAQPFLQHSFV